MTTVVDALTDATAELHNAALLFQTRADQVAAQLADFKGSAQTTINNYINRAPSAEAWIDGNVGVDAVGRGTELAPYKTLDYAMDHIDRSVRNVFYLLSDVTLNYYRPTWSKISIVGFARVPSGPYGWPYTYTNRKLTFAAEAFNSPRSDMGRVPAFFDIQQGGINFAYVDLFMPILPAGVLANAFPYHIAVSGDPLNFVGGSINAEAATNCGKLFSPTNSFAEMFFNTVTIGDNAKGQIYPSVAAGQDPNVVLPNIKTNLKAA